MPKAPISILGPSLLLLLPSPIWVTGADEISPKVLQALGSEPIQVRPACSAQSRGSATPGLGGGQGLGRRVRRPLSPSPALCPQYAVPVVKYDRKGYKPRSRQLLLTPNAVVIVEDAKVKQRIDYANLTGKPQSWAAWGGPPALTLEP